MFARLMELGISKVLLLASGFVVVTGVAVYGVTKPKEPTPVTIVVNESAAPSPITSQVSIAVAASPTIVATSTPKASPKASPSAVTVLSPTPLSSPSPSPSSTVTSPTPVAESSDTPPVLLKSIGINLDYYDPLTGKAGDLVFTKDKLQFNVLLTEYGFTIPGSQSSSGQDKKSPQPTWIVPMGTKVRSLVDGVVTSVPLLYSNDYSIMVATNSKSQWQYETEHVTNPHVKVGDTVTAGQIIAEVSPYSKDGNSGFGMVEIGILKGGNPPQHICPFAYLDPSVKDDIQKKLLAFYKSWEDYRGDTSLHNETAQSTPGCLTHEPIDG